MSSFSQQASRSFWLTTAARVFNTLASQMLSIAVGWSVYHQTHSPLALGLVGLAEFVPAFGLALWAGLVVDRGQPLSILRAATLVQASVAAAPLACVWLLPERPSALLASLYVASMVAGAVRAFLQPCLYAIVPRLVPRERLPWAAGISSALLQAARVVGPALGGLLYAQVGLTGSLVAPLLLLLSCLGCLVPVTLRQREAAPVPAAGERALFEGLKFVFGHGVLLPALSLDMICVLFGGVTAVLPAFAEQVLAAGPGALGWLRAAPAAGAVLCSLVLTRVDVRRHAGRALLWSVAGFGACTLCFALSRSVWLSFALLFVSGLLDSVSVQVRQLIVQLMSPEHMRGRISAVNSMFLGSSNELGEFESGLMAHWLGLVPSVLWGSSLCLVYVALAAARARGLRRLDLTQAGP